jgi:glycosyltransferase involved in cell wall biosynthesis
MTKDRRLWVITELYYPEETSTGYYLTKIAEGLAADIEVKVICGQPNYSRRGTRAMAHEVHNNVEIFRVPGTTLDKDVILFRLVNMVTLGLSVFAAAIRRFRQGDEVLVVTTPPNMPFIAAAAALARGAAYTLLVHDNYPEILVAVGKASKESLVYRVNEFLNRWLFKHATRIVAVGRDMRVLLSRKTDGLDVPIVTIPNWAELETVSPLPRGENRLLAELGLEDRFVLLYAGNIGRPNDIETIVAAAAALRDSHPLIHFIFLGSGAKRDWLESQIEKRGLVNVTLLAPRPRAEQPDFLNACDVALVSLVREMWGVSMPSRTYNVLAAGKPVLAITEPGSELDQVVKENELGWSVLPGDIDSLIAAVKAAAAADNLTAIGRKAREVAVEKYSLGSAIDEYRGLFVSDCPDSRFADGAGIIS